MRHFFRTLLVGGLLFSHNAVADDVGEAIALTGGTDFSVRAGNAIRVTCRDLASQSSSLSTAETDLFGRCGDMVQTVLAFTGASMTATNRYGITSNEEMYGILRQFSGEESSSQGRYTSEGAQSQFGNIGARLDAIHQGARGSALAFNFYGVNLAEAASSNHGSQRVPSAIIGGGAGSADADTGFAWFGTVDYGFGDRDASDNENEYDADSYGVTVGVDYAFDNGLVLGVTVGYNDYEVDFDSDGVSALVSNVSGGEMESDVVTVSGFIDYRMGSAYVSGILGIGTIDYDMERIVEIPASTAGTPAQSRLITSDTDGEQISAQLQFGYTFGKGAITFDLYGGLEIENIEIDSYTETDTSAGGGLGLAFGNQDIDSSQSFIGGALRRAIATGRGVVVPYASVEWRHEFSNNSRFVDARYALALGDVNNDGRSDNFALPTDDPDENFFDISVGVSGQFGNNLSVFLQYSSLVDLEDTSANLVTFGLRGFF